MTLRLSVAGFETTFHLIFLPGSERLAAKGKLAFLAKVDSIILKLQVNNTRAAKQATVSSIHSCKEL
ncbi:MAG TPA: hypothetical protein VFP68_18995 [Burkholderiaceae bacterium]|nr:hypothetical protein [Burkholderiaceae bacterium]